METVVTIRPRWQRILMLPWFLWKIKDTEYSLKTKITVWWLLVKI